MQLDEFKRFLLRGNVVELAVAIIIGLAFVAIVNSIVADLITPLIAMMFGEFSLSTMSFTINNAEFRYGNVLNQVLSFVVIAAVVFYLIVVPANHMMARYTTQPSPDPTTRQCPLCLSEVPKPASRCRFCTAEIEPVSM